MYLYSTLFVVPHTQGVSVRYYTLKVLRHGSHNVTCSYTNACLYLVSIHQKKLKKEGAKDASVSECTWTLSAMR